MRMPQRSLNASAVASDSSEPRRQIARLLHLERLGRRQLGQAGVEPGRPRQDVDLLLAQKLDDALGRHFVFEVQRRAEAQRQRQAAVEAVAVIQRHRRQDAIVGGDLERLGGLHRRRFEVLVGAQDALGIARASRWCRARAPPTPMRSATSCRSSRSEACPAGDGATRGSRSRPVADGGAGCCVSTPPRGRVMSARSGAVSMMRPRSRVPVVGSSGTTVAPTFDSASARMAKSGTLPSMSPTQSPFLMPMATNSCTRRSTRCERPRHDKYVSR